MLNNWHNRLPITNTRSIVNGVAYLRLSLISFLFFFILSANYAIASANYLQKMQIQTLPNGKTDVVLTFADAHSAASNHAFFTQNPARLVLDFNNTKNNLTQSNQKVQTGILQYISAVEANGRTRVVFDLGQVVPYQINYSGSEVHVVISNNSTRSRQVNRDAFASKNVTNYHEQYSLNNVDFKRLPNGGGQIIIALSNPKVEIDVQQVGGNISADILDTKIATQWQRVIDVKDFGTPVDLLQMEQKNKNAQLKVSAHGKYDYLSYQINNKFIIEMNPLSEVASNKANRKANYSGNKISLNFQSIPVRSVLQLLAEFTGLNMVASDSIKGNITLRLNQVPWDQALDIILKTQGLDKRETGNVVLVAPSKELADREKEELKAHNDIQELAPLQAELIQINYAEANDISTLIKSEGSSLLSSRGTISLDKRTNTLWVQETAAKLKEIRDLVQKLDIPVRQVLIEARVVNIDKTYAEALGVRFGVTQPNIPVTGTLAGANEIRGGASAARVSDLARRLNVNLPVTGASGEPGHFGLALARLGNGVMLDLELTALESEGHGHVISSPRVITANQNTARIESGEEIPYQQITSSGATAVAFKKAVLSLEVTPQITPDNKIVLTLKINQDKRSTQPEVLGVPSIDTRALQTSVLVDNGGTVVLGGIYEQTKTSNVNRIPFLGALPVFGALFRNTKEINNQTELLIFITPKVIQQTAMTE